MQLFEAAKSVSALDVAERYAGVQAVRKGRRAWCNCPFHNDRTPSCSFDLEGKFAGRFICSSCHTQGSSVDFVAKYFNEPANVAAKRICEDFGIEWENAGPEVRKKAQKKEAVEKLVDEIQEALAFASCVASGVISEAKAQMETLTSQTDRYIMEQIIADAEEFKTAILTPKDANTAYALITGEGVKDKLEGQYRRLKRIDDQTGTNYVSWYKRGSL